MLAPLSPFEAYRADLGRFGSEDDFGTADTVWLLLAHCLGRMSRAGESVREQIAEHSSEALADLIGQEPTVFDASDPHLADLRLIIAGLPALGTSAGANAVSRGCRGFAARMAEAGALSTAYAVLGHARTVVLQASDRERGLLTADQARVARQLGDLDSAEELYQVADMIGQRADDRELLARTALGRGVLARVRGNYPRAAELYRIGLAMSLRAQSRELEFFAHQGLTAISAVASKFDEALEHGWAAFRLCEGDAVRESEALVNLAQICLDCGYSRSALRSFVAALARTSPLRVRISALAGASLAAGRTGDGELLRRLQAELLSTVEQSALPYENAQALYQLSVAFSAVGDDLASERLRQRSLKMSNDRGFYELVYQCERAEIARQAVSPPPRNLGSSSTSLVFALESFEPDAVDSAFALTRSD